MVNLESMWAMKKHGAKARGLTRPKVPQNWAQQAEQTSSWAPLWAPTYSCVVCVLPFGHKKMQSEGRP